MAEFREAEAPIEAARASAPDWRAVGKHALALRALTGAGKNSADGLARQLEKPAYAENVAQFDVADKDAQTFQARHKRHARRAAALGALAACVGGVILFLGNDPDHATARMILGALQALLLALALWSGAIIAAGKPYRRWAEARSKAETCRIRQFQMLLAADEPQGAGELPYKLLALEYVRVFLMRDQRAWFEKRNREFRFEVWRGYGWRLGALLLVLFAAWPTVKAVVDTDVVRGVAPWLARGVVGIYELLQEQFYPLLGVIGGAMQTLVTCLAAMSLADRNKEAYGRMAKELDRLEREALPAANAAAQNGDALALERFWTRLSFELISENREWNSALSTAQYLTLDKLTDFPHLVSPGGLKDPPN